MLFTTRVLGSWLRGSTWVECYHSNVIYREKLPLTFFKSPFTNINFFRALDGVHISFRLSFCFGGVRNMPNFFPILRRFSPPKLKVVHNQEKWGIFSRQSLWLLLRITLIDTINNSGNCWNFQKMHLWNFWLTHKKWWGFYWTKYPIFIYWLKVLQNQKKIDHPRQLRFSCQNSLKHWNSKGFCKFCKLSFKMFGSIPKGNLVTFLPISWLDVAFKLFSLAVKFY